MGDGKFSNRIYKAEVDGTTGRGQPVYFLERVWWHKADKLDMSEWGNWPLFMVLGLLNLTGVEL